MPKISHPAPSPKVTEVWSVFRSLLIRLQKHRQLTGPAISEL
jgi:hypothetical protein